MGQEQKKYHITDDGKIFSVMEDGSVSEIGNVSTLTTNKEVVDKTTRPGSLKWMWIAIVSWIALIVCFIVIADKSDYIDYQSEINNSLYVELEQANIDLESKSNELDSIRYELNWQISSMLPITVTDIQFANVGQYNQIIDDYGSELYSDRICYLKPKITFTGKKTGSYDLTVKIIMPDGTFLHNDDSSPDGATYSSSIYSSAGHSTQSELLGWGWSEPGNYSSGNYGLQILYDDILIYATTFYIN